MDLLEFIQEVNANDYFKRLTDNPFAQFGTANRVYKGATLLPEQFTEENAYKEDQVKFRAVIANASSRYSPAQKKESEVFGTFSVALSESDIAREMTGRQYDSFLKLLNTKPSMEGVAALSNWANLLTIGLNEKAEKDRWAAIVTGSLTMTGDNNFTETVTYPTGSIRQAAGGAWSNDAYDPFEDIFDVVDQMYAKGFNVSRIVTSRKVVSILANNAIVRSRTSRLVVDTGGQLAGAPGRATAEQINMALAADGLPVLEQYDLRYKTQTGTGRFLPDTVMCFFADTGRDMMIERDDLSEKLPLPNTLGYYAIGRAAGQSSPGKVLQVMPKFDKPPRIIGEAWMTSLPVILEPEAIGVVNAIA